MSTCANFQLLCVWTAGGSDYVVAFFFVSSSSSSSHPDWRLEPKTRLGQCDLFEVRRKLGGGLGRPWVIPGVARGFLGAGLGGHLDPIAPHADPQAREVWTTTTSAIMFTVSIAITSVDTTATMGGQRIRLLGTLARLRVTYLVHPCVLATILCVE